MTDHQIPQISNPQPNAHILYNLAKTHTNEEIFLGLVAIESHHIRSIDDVFKRIREAIRALARQHGRSEDEVTDELLKAQKENGVHARNRAQMKADLFGRIRRSEGSLRGQRDVARKILEELQRKVKEEGMSIREKMAVGNILN